MLGNQMFEKFAQNFQCIYAFIYVCATQPILSLPLFSRSLCGGDVRGHFLLFPHRFHSGKTMAPKSVVPYFLALQLPQRLFTVFKKKLQASSSGIDEK